MQWFFLLPLRERHDQDEERAHEVDCGVRLILVWWTNRNAGRTPALRFLLTALFSSSRFPENWCADKIRLPFHAI